MKRIWMARQINGIDIQEDHTFVRLPAGMPADVLERLQRVRVKGRPLAAGVVERRPPARKNPSRIAANPNSRQHRRIRVRVRSVRCPIDSQRALPYGARAFNPRRCEQRQ